MTCIEAFCCTISQNMSMYPVQAPEERENKRQNLIKYINTYISD